MSLCESYGKTFEDRRKYNADETVDIVGKIKPYVVSAVSVYDQRKKSQHSANETRNKSNSKGSMDGSKNNTKSNIKSGSKTATDTAVEKLDIEIKHLDSLLNTKGKILRNSRTEVLDNKQ
jgi:hypothetical protein